MTRIPLVPMLIATVSAFFIIHYLFASITAQTTALLPVFLLAVLSVQGVPAKAITLLLVYSLGLMGILTPYASGPAPIWYSSGYIPRRTSGYLAPLWERSIWLFYLGSACLSRLRSCTDVAQNL